MPPRDDAGNYKVKPQQYLRLLGTLVALVSGFGGLLLGSGAMLIKHGRDLETQDRDRQLVHKTAETVDKLVILVEHVAEQQQEDHARLAELWDVHRRGNSR